MAGLPYSVDALDATDLDQMITVPLMESLVRRPLLNPARNMLARGEILRSQPSPRDPRPLWTKLDDIDLEAIFRLHRRFPVK